MPTRPAVVRRDAAARALITALAVLACLPGLVNTFVQDDQVLVRENARVHDLAHVGEILTRSYWPPPYPAELYRPVTTLLHALQYAVGGGHPMVFRVVSYAAYALAAVMFLALALRLLPRALALVAAALFAVHPVHVEAVALAVGQGELVVALCALAMVMRWADRRSPGRSLRTRDVAVLAALYAIAASAKEHGFVLPGLLVLWDWTHAPADASWRDQVRDTWRPMSVLAVVAVALLSARTLILRGDPFRTFTTETLEHLSATDRVLTMLSVVPQWLRLLLWPAHLRSDYSPAEFLAAHQFDWRVAIGLAVVLAATIVLVRARRHPAIAFGLGWTALGLLPVSNVLHPVGILVAERTLFLASAGAMLVVGGVLDVLLRERSTDARAMTMPRWLVVAAGVLVAAGLVRSGTRQHVWHDEATFRYHAAKDAPRSWRTQYALGDLLFDVGMRVPAESAYVQAIRFAPQPWRVRTHLARRLRDSGDDSTALRTLDRSLAEHAHQPVAQAERVAALIGVGRYDEALAAATSALPPGPIDSTHAIFQYLATVADSGRRSGMPPGALRIRIRTSDEHVR